DYPVDPVMLAVQASGLSLACLSRSRIVPWMCDRTLVFRSFTQEMDRRRIRLARPVLHAGMERIPEQSTSNARRGPRRNRVRIGNPPAGTLPTTDLILSNGGACPRIPCRPAYRYHS